MSRGRPPRIASADPMAATRTSWESMKYRCRSPRCGSYHLYGGRGIRVCRRWLRFENFLADMGIRPPGTTLDRLDSDGHYEPGNCRWATWDEQQETQRHYNQNTRKTHCKRGHVLSGDNLHVESNGG